MIAARLAGGNLFLPFLWWGGEHSEQLGALGALGFFEGILWVGDFGSTRSGSEHSDFFEGIFWVGDSFLGVVGCVLD